MNLPLRASGGCAQRKAPAFERSSCAKQRPAGTSPSFGGPARPRGIFPCCRHCQEEVKLVNWLGKTLSTAPVSMRCTIAPLIIPARDRKPSLRSNPAGSALLSHPTPPGSRLLSPTSIHDKTATRHPCPPCFGAAPLLPLAGHLCRCSCSSPFWSSPAMGPTGTGKKTSLCFQELDFLAFRCPVILVSATLPPGFPSRSGL